MILPGRLHAYIKTVVFDQPLFELQDGIVESRESLPDIVRLKSLGGDECGDEKSPVYIDATADRIYNFHRKTSFQNLRRKTLTEPPHI
jgi:hypothetical protein